MKKSYEIKMKDRTLTLLDTKGVIIAKVAMKWNRILLQNIETNVPKCIKTYVKDETWLWHIRLGRVNFDNLKMMKKRGY